VIHNINSEVAYRIFVKYGKTLRSNSGLFTSAFCEDITEEGKISGYSFSYLPDCYDYLKGIFSDNRGFL